MKNIIKSLLIVVAVAAVAGGATYSYFSDTARVTGNTFATGVLNIDAGGQDCHDRFGWNDDQGWHDGDNTTCNSDSNASGNPSGHNCHHEQVCTGTTNFRVANAQPGNCKTETIKITNTGTLTARDLVADKLIKSTAVGDLALCNALAISYAGLPINIIPGQSGDLAVTVCLPNASVSQNDLQGKTCNFDLQVDAKAYDNDEMR